MTMTRNTTLFLLIALQVFTVPVQCQVSEECSSESQTLQQDEFLDYVQDDLYTIYQNDYDKLCDFSSITSPDCGLEWQGNNKTYTLACQDKGGQILERRVKLKCGVSSATLDWDLGVIPQCIGSSCDKATVQPADLNDPRVQEFLNNLTYPGCKAEISASSQNYNLFPVAVTGLVVSVWSLF